MPDQPQEQSGPHVFVGADTPLARQMGLCKGGDDFWCGALLNNGADHKPGCPAADCVPAAYLPSVPDGECGACRTIADTLSQANGKEALYADVYRAAHAEAGGDRG